MTEAKGKVRHTPGPWTATQNNPESDLTYTIVAGNQDIADVYESGTAEHDMESEDEANARLIAAAPELLVALKQVNVDWDNFSGNRNDMSRYVSIMADTIKDVQAAIAKAEGHNG